MSLESIFQAVQNTDWATALRESALVYPIVMSTHLACIAIFGGMILMTDLRLLGVALKGVPASEVIRQLRLWKRVGFCVMVTCGVLLASSKAMTYFPNPYFWTKVTLLALVGAHAAVFKSRVYDNPDWLDREPAMPGIAKWAGAISLALWFGVMAMGRLIAYYEPPRQ